MILAGIIRSLVANNIHITLVANNIYIIFLINNIYIIFCNGGFGLRNFLVGRPLIDARIEFPKFKPLIVEPRELTSE